MKRMRLHILTDGRDVPDGTCHEYLATLQKDLDDFTKQDRRKLVLEVEE